LAVGPFDAEVGTAQPVVDNTDASRRGSLVASRRTLAIQIPDGAFNSGADRETIVENIGLQLLLGKRLRGRWNRTSKTNS
jgi:hypothetical protein